MKYKKLKIVSICLILAILIIAVMVVSMFVFVSQTRAATTYKDTSTVETI